MVEKKNAWINLVIDDQGYSGDIDGDSSLVLRCVADQMIRILRENYSKDDAMMFLWALKKDMQASFRRLEKGGDD